jgi:hypothetical protein
MNMKHKYLIHALFAGLTVTISYTGFSQSKDYTVISFVQDDKVVTLNRASDSVVLAKQPFSIVYYGKRYDSQKEKFHAMQVAVLKDPADTLKLAVGKNINDVAYLEPGSGMAPGGRGLYDAIVITNAGHHYLYYENEAERRVSRVSVVNDLLELEWHISGASIDDDDIPLAKLTVPALYFVFFQDRNLNEIIDAQELKIVKVMLK